jgi:hypothetical protein
MKKLFKIYSAWEILFILIGLAGSIVVYIGFFFPDPYALGRWGYVSRLLLVGIRILFPLCVIGILALIHLIKIRRIYPAHVALLFVSLIAVLMIAYPFASAKFKRWLDISQKRDLYHPYLQLAPQDLKEIGKKMDYKIFCLGGSTTEFLDSEGRGWPDRLEKQLNDSLDRQIGVWNQGRQWYTTLHSLINYETNLRPFRPDALIVMHMINDLLHNADFCYFSFGPFKEDYRHFYGPLSRILKNPTLLSTVGDFIKMLWYHRPRDIVEQTEFPGLVPFKRNLNTLIDLAEKDGVTVILVTQPNMYKSDISEKEKQILNMLNYEAIGPKKKWSYETALRGFEQYTQAVKDVARERSVLLIDLEKSIPKTLDYFYDDVHYTDTAFDLVAAKIAKALIENKIFGED